MKDDEFYLDNGLFVLTERYLKRRGTCCGNGCRHCPFGHLAVPMGRRAGLTAPWSYFGDADWQADASIEVPLLEGDLP